LEAAAATIIRLCGPLAVRFDGRRVERALPSRQGRLLFAYLVLHRSRPVSRDELMQALWPECLPDRSEALLSSLLSRLRRALPAGALEGRGQLTLRLAPDAWVDVEVAEASAAQAQRALAAGRPADALAFARAGLTIAEQPLLAGMDRSWVDECRRARSDLTVTLLESVARAGLAVGGTELAAAEAAAGTAVEQEPFRESATALLMEVRAARGNTAEALRAYDRLRIRLRDELGASPAAPVRRLNERLLRADVSGVATRAIVLTLPRPLQAPASPPFVGRDVELGRLRERWTQVHGGARSAAVIGGEPGIGKTRLASELAGTVHEQGGLVLHGRCDEGLSVPYQPFVEALRPYARAVGLDRLREELGDLAPELGRLLPELCGLGTPVHGDPESERFALFEAVAALIEAMTREQRALLVLDDLHWAANPTLLLLRHLIRSERPLGVLLLGTYRDTELGRPLAYLLADLHRDASIERVSIRGLDEPAIEQLLEATVGRPLDEPASQLAALLEEQTAGNPFFLRELLTHAAENDAASRDGEWLRAGVTAAQLRAPEGLRHVIDQRVARLSAPTRRALSVGAVAGATFSFMLLERVLGARSGVLDALEEAVAAGLLTEAGQGDYGFAHALVRQTIYVQLGTARRMCLHRQLGEALEALGNTEAHVEALAHHFAQAAADGQGVKAATHALAAGRSATARLGYDEAVAHYERGLHALSLAGPRHGQPRCELLLALGQASWDAGDLDKAREAYGRAAGCADKLGDVTALAHAALGFCGPHRLEAAAAVTRRVAELLQRALAALGDDDNALRARLMGRLAAYEDAGRKTVLAREALEIARRVADKATLADVLASAHRAIRGPDSVHESIALAAELGRVAGEIGDDRLRALAHGRLLDLLLELADIDAVERELDALQRLAEPRKDPYLTWLLAGIRASHAVLMGQLDRGETFVRNALAQRVEGRDEVGAQTFGVQMFILRREQGRVHELMDMAEGFAAQHPQLTVWRCILASVYAQLERTTEARLALETLAGTDFSHVPRDGGWLPSLCALSEVAFYLGDVPRAQLLYELLVPYGDRCAVTTALRCRGPVSRPLGLLATALSQYEDAERHFAQALEMSTQIRSPLWMAHTQHDYAHMLLRRNQPGDNDEALRALAQALAVAEELGLKAVADRLRPLQLKARAAAMPHATFTASSDEFSPAVRS
jgi:DNA-binding SARP family transcriptional activator/tetratricopeptide (TPR) repeat protein